jgi:sulfur transfer complex TusBCD TusB component (DsrH family)
VRGLESPPRAEPIADTGCMSLAEPLIARGLRREMDATFVAVKDLFERLAVAISPQEATR